MLFLLFLFSLALIRSTPTEIYENTFFNLNLGLSSENYMVFHSYLPKRTGSLTILGFSEEQTNMKIYISMNPIDLNSSQYLTICSEFKNKNPCIIEVNNEDSENNVFTLYLVVKCFSKSCDYRAKIFHNKEFTLDYDIKENYEFKEKENLLINLKIPLKNYFDRLVFVVEFMRFNLKLENKFAIYFSNGNPIKYNLPDRFIAIFDHNDKDLCENCTINCFMNLHLNAIINFEIIKYSSPLSKIQFDKVYYDFINGSNRTNSYKINFDQKTIQPNKEFTFFFSLRDLQSKRKNFFLNPDFLPNETNKFMYNNSLNTETDLDILVTKQEIERLNISASEFYITIDSNTKGVFLLDSKILYEPKIKIHLGIPEIGKIYNNDLVFYECIMFNDDKDELEAELTLKNGGASIFVKICERNCEIFNLQDILQDKSTFSYIAEGLGDKSIVFMPKCPYNIDNCSILFGIMGKNSLADASSYSLLLKKKFSMGILIENENYETHIEYGEKDFLKLYVDNEGKDIEGIRFSINTDLEFIVSRNKLCENKEECEQRKGNGRNFIEFTPDNMNNTNFDGIYYVQVIGSKSTTYSLLPHIVRKNQTNSMIFLSDGKPVREVLSLFHPEIFFKYELNNEQMVSLEINLNSDEKLDVLVSDIGVPNQMSFKWISSDGFLHIPMVQNLIAQNFFIMVRPQDLRRLDGQNIKFTIMISTNLTVKHLEKNSVVYEYLEPMQTHQYMFFFNQLEQEIEITANMLSQNPARNSLKVYVGHNLYSNYSSAIGVLYPEDHQKNILKLSSKDLKELCPLEDHHCRIFMLVENNYTESLMYSLSVKMFEFALEIRERFEQRITINPNQTEALLYFSPKKGNKTIDIQIHCNQKETEVQIIVLNSLSSLGSSSIWSNTSLYSLNSSSAFNHFLSLSPSKFRLCLPDCIALFKIVSQKTSYSNSISISIVSDYKECNSGKLELFSLSEKESKFFYLKINNSSIFIEAFLTSFSGNAFMYFNVVEESNFKLPIPLSYDFSSYAGTASMNITQLLEKYKKNPIIIANIYCVSIDCKLGFRMEGQNLEVTTIHSGLNLKIKLNKNGKKVLRFWNSNEKELAIKVNKEEGSLVIEGVFCPEISDKGFSENDCLKKNNAVTKLIKDHTNNNIYIEKSSYESFCNQCYIVILLSSSDNFQGSFLILNENDSLLLEDGKPVLDSLDPKEINKYRIFGSYDKNMELLITLFSGSPTVYVTKKYQKELEKYEIKSSFFRNGVLKIDLPKIEKEDWSGHVYHLAVDSQMETNYSIRYDSNQIAYSLQYGVLHFDSLQKNQSKSYEFIKKHETETESLSLILSNGEPNEILVGFLFKNETSTEFINYPLFEYNTSAKSYIFNIPGRLTGQWMLNIKNNKNSNENLNYSIILNSANTVLLPIGSLMEENIEFGRNKLYEIYIPKYGYLALSIQQCGGGLEVSYTNDYTQYAKNEIENQIHISSKNNLNIIKVNKGIYYFSFKNIQKNKGFISLQTNLYDSYYDIPEIRFTPGNEGTFAVTSDQDNPKNLFIEFFGLECWDCKKEELQKIEISYYLIISKTESSLLPSSNCLKSPTTEETQLPILLPLTDSPPPTPNPHFPLPPPSPLPLSLILIRSTLKKFLVKSSLSTSSAFLLSLPSLLTDLDSPLFFSVSAFMPPSTSITYKTMEFKNNLRDVDKNTQVFFFILVSFCVFLIAVLFCVISKFSKKLKKVEGALNYEMQDVRNVAQVRGVNERAGEESGEKKDEGKREKSYVGLVEE